MRISKRIFIRGIVQGVGFRPFVYTTAKRLNITGWVCNSSSGVEILALGQTDNINTFLKALENDPPPLSRIDSFSVEDWNESPEIIDFSIIESLPQPGEFIPVSPDMSICDDCLRELFEPQNRRYRYPFINCTNCGPRFSIIKDIPYDRPNTTMSDFPLCPACKKEYDDPFDRRFHAQPVACSECGPQLWFEDLNGIKSIGVEAIASARNYIKNGKIIAVKGLGGFHIACNAFNPQTLRELRFRKKRSAKPFAVMAFSETIIEQQCQINADEVRFLKSRQKPIVILRRRPESNLPEEIAPNVDTIGAMLPYTPLHYLLLEASDGFPELLVMTSGNLSEEPIAYTNDFAKKELSGIVDGYLFHNRGIKTRIDDSVLAGVANKTYFFRRSRGYAPDPIRLNARLPQILAVGAELKNTFCLTRDSYAFVSHHIGDLQNAETLDAFERSIPHYQDLFRIKPQILSCDLHPDYLSTRYAIQKNKTDSLLLVQVQHHHAHMASVMAENEHPKEAPVIGICFDGTGLGSDGNIWGGEFLYGVYAQFNRLLHLEYMPLPGGDKATLNPARVAAAYLWKCGIEWEDSIPSIKALHMDQRGIILNQLGHNINCPLTSSMGRLFDAVASLIGIRHEVNYEAQAAIELEAAIKPVSSDIYQVSIEADNFLITPILSGVINDLKNHIPQAIIAAKFHNSICEIAVIGANYIRQITECNTVALSGGVWQNLYLLNLTKNRLASAGFNVLAHQHVPSNDGGISLGQAMVAFANSSNN